MSRGVRPPHGIDKTVRAQSSEGMNRWQAVLTVFLGNLIVLVPMVLVGHAGNIMLVDYFAIRETELNHDALFTEDGEYGYRKGWNPYAVIALLPGVLPNLPGFLKAAGFIGGIAPPFETLYTYARFVGLAISAPVHYLLMPPRRHEDYAGAVIFITLA